MTPLALAFDFDGVLADRRAQKAAVLQQCYGIVLSPELCARTIVVGRGLLDHAEYDEFLRMVYCSERYHDLLSAVDGMPDALLEFQDAGHAITIATSMEPEAAWYSGRWLRRYPIRAAIVPVGKNRSKLAAITGRKVMVDDDLEKLRPLVGHVPHRFLFTWPHNVNDKPRQIARRVTSWAELTEHIRALAA